MTTLGRETAAERDPAQDRNYGREEFSLFMELLPRWNVEVKFSQESSPNEFVGNSDLVRFSRIIDLPGFSQESKIKFQNRVRDILAEGEDSYLYSVLTGYPEEEPSSTMVFIAVGRWPSPKMAEDLAEVEEFIGRLEAGELI